MAEDEATGALMLSVFDGHGEAGHLVSQQFKDKYAAAVFNSAEYKSGGEGINTALAKQLLTVEADVLKDGSRHGILWHNGGHNDNHHGQDAVLCQLWRLAYHAW